MESKIINGLERLSEVLKSLLWEKAKVHGISPIQIQIMLFVADHQLELSNVSYLAKDLNVTKATISDAVRVLLAKDLLTKDFSPTDSRRYNLILRPKGKRIVTDLAQYSLPLSDALSKFSKAQQDGLFKTISQLIYQLNQAGVIQVQRTCFTCQHYKGDKKSKHFCKLLNDKLLSQELRLDCREFEEKATSL